MSVLGGRGWLGAYHATSKAIGRRVRAGLIAVKTEWRVGKLARSGRSVAGHDESACNEFGSSRLRLKMVVKTVKPRVRCEA